jgi:flagellar M-ring protein FliF
VNEKWAQAREKLAIFWNQYSKTQKWVLASTAALLLFAIILLTYLFTRTQYEIAFQNLDSTDSAAIIQYLEGNGISYKLSPDGTSISVPSASAPRVRVDVGSQGMVQNGSFGFDGLSQSSSSIGTTQQEFDVKYRNALNGEVQQLLQGMQGVSKADALITLPESTAFLNDTKDKASASIVMTFKPGYRPKQAEVDSYFNLVKTAVPSLDFDGITITSSSSGELSPSFKGGSGVSGGPLYDQFEVQDKFESDLRKNIQQFLTPIVGMDNMVVSVVSSLNFDKMKSQKDEVLPLQDNDNNGIKVSETNTSETQSGQAGQTGGVAGTGATDITNYPGAAGSGSSSSEKVSTTTNWEFTRLVTNIDYGPYKVKDLSVNVALDSAALPPAKLAEIQGVLRSSVRVLLAESGMDLSDAALAQKVNVVSQTFAAGDTGSGGITPSGYLLAGLGLLAVALLGGGGYYLYRRRKAAQEEAAAMADVPRVELPTIDIENVNNENEMRKQLEGLAKRKPDEFVNLLRTWLADE